MIDADRIIVLVRAECEKALGHPDADWMIRFLAVALVDSLRGVSPGFMRLPPIEKQKLPGKPPHEDLK